MLREYKNKWIKVKCHKCEAEQVIFGHASTEVKCVKCNEVLATPRGGKAAVKAEILQIL